jgi:iron(III) transport system permease protein
MSAPAQAALKRRRRPAEFLFLGVVVALILLYGVLYPNLGLVAESFGGWGGWTLDIYRTALGQAGTRLAILSSLALSVATVAGCALVGVPLALLLDRVALPGRRVFAAVAAAPLLLPPLVGTIAFIFLYGESGIVTRAIVRMLGLDGAPFRLRGFWAVLAFHVYTIYPYFFVFASAALKRLDPSIEEAARSLGASPAVRLRRVLLPSLRGALVAAAILTFMTSMASFSAPYLFGGDLRVLTLQVYEAKINNERGLAVVQTVILAVLSLVALSLFARSERQGAVSGTKGAVARRARVASPAARALALVVGAALSAVILAPHATIVLLSFARISAWTTQVLPPSYTLENYARLFSETSFVDPIVNSLVMAAVSSLAALVFGVAAAYFVTRYRFRGRATTALLLLVPWSLPGTVLAYQIVETYSQPALLTAGAALAGSYWLLPMIYFLRNMPLVLRAAQVNLAQLDPSLEAAARSLGASWATTMRRVVLPLILPGALSGTLLAFALALGEFVASIVAYVYSNRPISVQIDISMRQGDLGTAAAYGAILILAVGIALLGLGKDDRGRAAQ